MRPHGSLMCKNLIVLKTQNILVLYVNVYKYDYIQVNVEFLYSTVYSQCSARYMYSVCICKHP